MTIQVNNKVIVVRKKNNALSTAQILVSTVVLNAYLYPRDKKREKGTGITCKRKGEERQVRNDERQGKEKYE